MNQEFSMPGIKNPGQKSRWAGLIATLFCGGTMLVAAETNIPEPAPSQVLTNIKQLWDFNGAAATQPYPIKTEVVIYYFDRAWNCVFGESQGRTTFLPLADAPMAIKAGQRLAIDGWVVPSNQRFQWEKTSVRVLEENVQIPSLESPDLTTNAAGLRGSMVSISGLIERVKIADSAHVQLFLLSGPVPLVANVLTTSNDLPFKSGDYVRMKGVFVPQIQRNVLTELGIWINFREDVKVTGSLATDPRFAIPPTPVEKISQGLSSDQPIRVEGIVRHHEPGKWITLWDDTGQVSIESEQTQPLQFGDRVEAIGFPYLIGMQQCLRNARFRIMEKSAQTNALPFKLPPSATLRLAAQIQHLSAEDVNRHVAVNLRAVLLWSHPRTPFAHVQDVSGGIRVANPTWQDTNFAPGTVVLVRGEVTAGEYVPVVTNAVISRVGWRGFDSPQPVSLERALTGMDEGRWVEMRGFVHRATQSQGLMHLELSTSSGEFHAWTPISPAIDSLVGTIVRITGVCTVLANERRQLTGIELWVPDQNFVRIDENRPADIFATDYRPLGNLRRFNFQNDLNQRVKTIGTVVLHSPGRYLYVQDGPDSVFALSRQTNFLQLGDQVEVVGLPGNEQGRFLLREAVFRRLSNGIEPAPLPLPTVDVVVENMGGMLTRVEGVLLNTLKKNEGVRLLLRNGGGTFEAAIESNHDPRSDRFDTMQLGSRLELTGVYEVQNDEYGRPGSFLLLLRSWDDVRILAQPSWWTLPRLLTLLLVVLIVFAIALIWAFLMAHKNSLLRQTEADLHQANDRLSETNRELEAFSYSISHDLRAPLRNVSGFASLLRKQSVVRGDPEADRFLTILSGECTRMGQLIDSLLAFSRVARAEVKGQSLDPAKLIAEVRAELHADAAGRAIEWQISPLPIIHGDPTLLRQVFANLIANALKFTRGREPAVIEIGARADSNPPGEQVIFVRDNGAGFDSSQAEKLFGVFQRLHTLREFEGTGIGLATVRRIVTRHGGRVWAEAIRGRGATFYFSLPKPSR
ncbi:MAG: hypothetical protein H7Y43_14200 [Akkermansiaceae bacterium]|nr:hypothetical protein [Verrucomicrobiales bacterium]